ncbi:TetR/AcrR family transcriptional regulator [Actinomadura litoris]|uniref:TetR family transcriptional regulator n=1 Tax=Actinomadura litoris TaxID=2678616 RepID=A0A7K1KSQ6_9ACTN|nr:TetR/AcrR family transcriptional regulator [Actinomadura litoris]MUN35220.1 TetR family transcriptional regulator [Actinomadura litoris]
MARARYHHGDLRGALLDAAEALVRERGPDGWSLREASARVGVSPSAAYHHFDSRGALVGALSGRVLARLGERLALDADAASADPLERLIAYGRGYVAWAVDDPAVARLAFGAGGAVGPVSPHPHDALTVELDRLLAGGGLPPSARPGAEFLFWAAVHGLATLLMDGLVRLDGPRAVETEAERLVRAVLAGLAHEAPPPRDGWPAARSAHSDRVAATGPATPENPENSPRKSWRNRAADAE